MSTASKNELDQAFEAFEAECCEGKTIRKEMIDNLRKVASNPDMMPSQFDKAMVIQSKLMVLKTLDDLLKSNEDVSLKKLKMKLTRKDSESNGMVGTAVVAMLKQIRAIGEENEGSAPKQTPEDAKKALAERTQALIDAGGKEAKAVTVLKGETIENDTTTEVERPADEPEEE